jgi:hypothetical protein
MTLMTLCKSLMSPLCNTLLSRVSHDGYNRWDYPSKLRNKLNSSSSALANYRIFNTKIKSLLSLYFTTTLHTHTLFRPRYICLLTCSIAQECRSYIRHPRPKILDNTKSATDQCSSMAVCPHKICCVDWRDCNKKSLCPPPRKSESVLRGHTGHRYSPHCCLLQPCIHLPNC